MASDDEQHWSRQLLVVLVVLAVVALGIGGLVSLVALGAAKVTGLDSARSTATARPSLVVPSGTPTVGLEQYPDPSGSPRASGDASSSSSPSAEPTKKARPISLQAFPRQVGAGQRINLTGTFAGGEGARLQVQRREAGSWSDFPVTPAVSGGQFATYVTTSRSGPQKFRVADPASGKVSNAVTVTIG